MNPSDVSNRLAEMPAIRRLGARARDLLARRGMPTVVRAGRALYYQGDRAERWYILLDGRLALTKYRADETTVSLGAASPGDILGLPESLLGTGYLQDATAREAIRALGYGEGEVGYLAADGELLGFFLRVLAKATVTLHTRLEQYRPDALIARYLLDHLGRGPDGRRVVAVTQEALADAVGVTRETVNKYMALLQRDGVAAVRRGTVEVCDVDALIELAPPTVEEP